MIRGEGPHVWEAGAGGLRRLSGLLGGAPDTPQERQSARTIVGWAEKSPHLPSGSLALSFTE